MTVRTFPCRDCGADVVFAPATATLTCPYCGRENPVPEIEGEVLEQDFAAHLARLAAEAETEERLAVKCQFCGAETTFGRHVTAGACAFCGSPLVIQGASRRLIRPAALLPFRIDEPQARQAFRDWTRRLWLAPGGLKRYARDDHPVRGVYIPYWTFDCRTISAYRGERGDDYWVTESFWTRQGGRSVRRTRRVRRTRWSPAAGVVRLDFDDVLAQASQTLPRRCAERLDPWDLAALKPYSDAYLSGFESESYQIDLAEGFAEACRKMDGAIEAAVRRDIGGDHQRIHNVRTQREDVTFKHILLPIWISAYRFRDRSYRFLVNGRTGEVQGERPWSRVKIAALALAALALAVAGLRFWPDLARVFSS